MEKRSNRLSIRREIVVYFQPPEYISTTRNPDIRIIYTSLWTDINVLSTLSASQINLNVSNVLHVIRNRIAFCIALPVLLSMLQWRHNTHDGVSNHRRLDCSLNCLFRRRSTKTSKFRVTGLCEGKQPVTGRFISQKPVTRKMFSFGDVIMLAGVCRYIPSSL